MPDREQQLEELTFKGVETDRRVFYCMDGGDRRELKELPHETETVLKEKVDRLETTVRKQSKLLSLIINHLEQNDLIDEEELNDMLLEAVR